MTNVLEAIVFDVDGTLAETEGDGHRVAYDAAFEELDLPWRWDGALYGRLLAIAGGKERLTAYITREHPRFVTPELPDLVRRIHDTKGRHFARLAKSIVLRPGVERLVREARAAGIALAIATTASPSAVEALLEDRPGLADAFRVIAAGDVVPHKKPAPDIYSYAIERLGVAAERCLAIEDAAIGVRAARAAGLTTLVTVSAHTVGQAFDGAAAVLSDLGEPGAAATTFAGPPPPRGFADVAYARELVARSTTVS